MSDAKLTGLVLAGGRSTRMGGQDKAWVTLAGMPLLAHAVTRLSPQVDRLAINSNNHAEQFAAFGLPVLPDEIPGFAGPLAGIHSGLQHYPNDWLIAVAVDLPGIPDDLVTSLRAGIGEKLCAYASDGRRHALAILFRPGAAGAVRAYLDSGGRRVGEFLAAQGSAVAFNRPQDRNLFVNLNTPEELRQAERERSIRQQFSQTPPGKRRNR